MADLILGAMRQTIRGGRHLARQIVISAVASIVAALAVPSIIATYRGPQPVHQVPAPLMVVHQDVDAAFVIPGPSDARSVQPVQRAAAGLAEALVARAQTEIPAAPQAAPARPVRRAAAPLPAQRPAVAQIAPQVPSQPLDLVAMTKVEPAAAAASSEQKILGIPVPKIGMPEVVTRGWTSARSMVAGVFR
ncbi:hypothetical protein E8L99_14005 [Phreatobacter aquaticus]|uniref:Uncharacterized protein n=1 Tax=Phreatobacter aquaticus TaxID=2570229 RepID=A0A4D7QMC7_9HYPH|nr:hypothetical protein [Phreatobacter aquaticus]QCK86789.1 hypothetical protein E8L99_14005 [Phreatobacter aquaticus]